MDMNKEVVRLQTFATWPSNAPVEATRVAKGGFHATGNGTETQCHWCGLKINDWSYGDQVSDANFVARSFSFWLIILDYLNI